ncbi:MAG TPA: hypothetical protein VF840_09575 [Terriglobales bacterium]
MAKNALLILRKQRASLDRAIRALEELQDLRFTVPEDSVDAAVGQAGPKVLHLCRELDREELDQPPPLPTGTDRRDE